MPILILCFKESCLDVMAILLAITVGRKGAPWTLGAWGWNVCITLINSCWGICCVEDKNNN